MTRPRSEQISLKETAYYHCYSRCVRRAFLCGRDALTGRCYEHRRALLEERLFELAKIFTIDILSYSVMSNHYHVVLRIDNKTANNLSEREIVERWCRLYRRSFKGHNLAKSYLDGDDLGPKEQEFLRSHISRWQKNLSSLSWFMRNINEYMSRVCNKEDNCSGHFWESRFKCRALLDKKALLTCMAYVDLNPIKACDAKRLEDSKFTSVFHRIKEKNNQKDGLLPLYPFIGDEKDKYSKGLNIYLSDYLDLLTWSSKQIAPRKKSYIQEDTPSMLNELQINEANWLYLVQNFDSAFKGMVGMYYRIKKACQSFGIKRSNNFKAAKTLFGSY